MTAEELAKEIARVSCQIENIASCTRMYINTANDKVINAVENKPPEECIESLKEEMLGVLGRHRAKLIIELAEASGMRPDDQLAIEGETEG